MSSATDESIDIQTFLSNRRTHNSDLENALLALRFLSENEKNFDIITYNQKNYYPMKNVSVLNKDNNGNYYYDVDVDKIGDIVDNINITSCKNLKLKTSYIINCEEYMEDEFNEFVLVAALYTNLKIRITFLEKPLIDDILKINLRYYFLQQKDRRLLIQNKVKTKSNKYFGGECRNGKKWVFPKINPLINPPAVW